MRLLLVEDYDLLGTAMQKSLARTGYAVDWVRSVEEALGSLHAYKYDCVLLDLGLPGAGGEELVKHIRKRNLPVSVIILTAQGNVKSRVELLDIGADDYMVKPVDLSELSARIRSVLRRAEHNPVADKSEPEYGPLKLYPTRQTATWHGALVPLTTKEFWLLEALVRHKNQILSQAQLEDALYSGRDELGSNAIAVYIHSLRRKFSANLILTVRGAGYQLGPADPQG